MAPKSVTPYVLFAVSSVGIALLAKHMMDSKNKKALEEAEDTSLMNSAYVFVKPHANTPKVQEFVKSKLVGAGLTVLSESDISGDTIDEKKLIDQHYYAIASKATILPAKDIPVPPEKFEVS